MFARRFIAFENWKSLSDLWKFYSCNRTAQNVFATIWSLPQVTWRKANRVAHSLLRFDHKSCTSYYQANLKQNLARNKCHNIVQIAKLIIFLFLSYYRPLFTEVQLINPSRAALVPVLPLSPENSQNNISNAPHPADIHPAYRIPYMQLLHTLHSATSPQSSLHGKFL